MWPQPFTSRLVYSNVPYRELPLKNIQMLQFIQNTARELRVSRELSIPVLLGLYFLPVGSWIQLKVLVLTNLKIKLEEVPLRSKGQE